MKSETFSAKKYSDTRWAGSTKPELVRINKCLNLIGQNKKVLDIGAYNGKITKLIKAQNNEVWAVDAMDTFATSFYNEGITFTKADIEEKLPYPDNTFDVVFAGEVIEHLVNTDGFLSEIKRILKKDGRLIITTPNAASLARRILLLMGQNPYFEASYTYPGEIVAGHLRYFTFALLRDFLKFNGYTIISRSSDVVNITNSLSSEGLATIFPALGRSIIIEAGVQK